MPSNNCHLHLSDVCRSYSNLQLHSLQQLKIASHIFPLSPPRPLHYCSFYTNFIHNLPPPNSPPAAVKLYSIIILYYYPLPSIFLHIKPTLTWYLGYLGQGIDCLPILIQNCTPVHILITSKQNLVAFSICTSLEKYVNIITFSPEHFHLTSLQ